MGEQGAAAPSPGCPRGLAGGRLIVISGPSGVGKTTICERVTADERFVLSVSATTRPMRPGEVEGREYHYLTEAEFRERVTANGFLEWAEVHGCLYGTLREQVERVRASGRHVVLNIDTQGARTLRRQGEDAFFVFLLPPGPEALEERLRRRATDPEEVIRRRLAQAEEELAEAPRYDVRVVNDDLERAASEVREHVLAAVAAEHPGGGSAAP